MDLADPVADEGPLGGAEVEAVEPDAPGALPVEPPVAPAGPDELGAEVGGVALVEPEGAGAALAAGAPELAVAPVGEEVALEVELVADAPAPADACAESDGALGGEFVAALPDEPAVEFELVELEFVATGEDVEGEV